LLLKCLYQTWTSITALCHVWYRHFNNEYHSSLSCLVQAHHNFLSYLVQALQ
jgi:glucose-6-phosphate isomerase